jgi:hypothetical protein
MILASASEPGVSDESSAFNLFYFIFPLHLIPLLPLRFAGRFFSGLSFTASPPR